MRRRTAARRTRDRRPGRVPARAARVAGPPGPGWRDAARTVAARASQRSAGRGRRAAAARTLTTRRRSRPGRARPRSAPRPPAEADERDHRPPPSALGQDAHRLVGLQGGQDERPAKTRRQPRHARLVEPRHAEDDGVLDRGDLLDRTAGPGWSGGVPGGTRSVTSAAVPTDSRGTTTSPSSRAPSSTAIPSRPSRTSNGHPPALVLEVDPATVAPELEPRPAKDERPMRVVLELVLGVDPAARPGRSAAGPRPAPAPRRR